MPRVPRLQSESNIHPVMLHGINQMQLFYDDGDCNAFIERLMRYKSSCTFSL
jgi:hypothetical protein